MAIQVRQPLGAASPSVFLPLLLALGALHCDDGATIILEGQTVAPSTPGGDGDGSSAGPRDGMPGDGMPEAPSGGPDSNGSPEEPGAGGSGGGASNPGGPSGGAPSEPPPGVCQPRAVGGPFWLTEGETVSIPLECATGVVLPGELGVNLPPNAAFDAATSRIIFTPALDQAGVHALDISIAGTSERAAVEVQVADRFDDPANVPVNPATYTEEFGLPVLHLGADPGINGDEYLPASITYRGKAFANAEAKYRGNTSLRYPKKSFTLKFDKEDRFGDELSVAGFTRKRKVTLTTTFDDNSYLRARLAFELWNRIGVAHVQVQAYSAVVYLNGAFWGVYTVTDHVDRHLMDDSGLFEDGNLYKARNHDANFRLTRDEEPYGAKERLSEGYTKEEGTPLPEEPGANADLEALVSWVASSTPAQFQAELDTRLVRREYEDWWLLVSLIMAGDSVGKNSYHYRDARDGAPDSRFHVVPWDFNESFGQTWLTDRRGREPERDPEELSDYNQLFQRFLGEPALRGPLVARYRTALENEWELGSVLASVDQWAAELRAVAERDERKWGSTYTSYFAGERAEFTSHAEEVEYVRQWITERWRYVSQYY